MKISVKVKPNSKVEKVDKTGENEFILYVRETPKEGKANKAVIKLLSEYFAIPRSRLNIIYGYTSRNKIIEIK